MEFIFRSRTIRASKTISSITSATACITCIRTETFSRTTRSTENAAGAAIMFSKDLIIDGNRFINNRGHRAYGLIFQSSDHSRIERNEITENAVGLSFNQCNANEIAGNRVAQNYIGLRYGSNSDGNRFTENIFAHNLHPVETGGSDVSGSRWAVNGVGNFWGDAVRTRFGSRRRQRPASSRTRSLRHFAPRFSNDRISFG